MFRLRNKQTERRGRAQREYPRVSPGETGETGERTSEIHGDRNEGKQRREEKARARGRERDREREREKKQKNIKGTPKRRGKAEGEEKSSGGGKNVSGTGYNGRIAHEYNEILQCNSHKALETTKASGLTGANRVGGGRGCSAIKMPAPKHIISTVAPRFCSLSPSLSLSLYLVLPTPRFTPSPDTPRDL